MAPEDDVTHLRPNSSTPSSEAEASAAIVLQRMLELTSTQAPWHRGLWRTGTTVLGRELVDEASDPRTPSRALGDMGRHLLAAANVDRGVAPTARQYLGDTVKSLKSDSGPSLHAVNQLEEYVNQLERDYLLTWADHIESEGITDLDGTARRLVSHFLGTGYHRSSLYSWLREFGEGQAWDNALFVNMLRSGSAMLARPEHNFQFCVPMVNRIPIQAKGTSAPQWLTPQETKAWKQRNAPDADPIRHQGSVLLTVKARDFNSALSRVRARILDLKTTFELGMNNPLRIQSEIWSKEKGIRSPSSYTDRRIKIGSIERLDLIAHPTFPDFITNALALVQPLRTSPPHLALVSGWSAIESLLIGPGDTDHSLAAGRFARIVAASLVRAEMTSLAWRYAKNAEGSLAEDIKDSPDNVSRVRLFAKHLIAHTNSGLIESMDKLAATRMQELLWNPQRLVTRIGEILAVEFLRLYRKRNLIAHGGKASDGSLHLTAELISPLIGAGIDRLVNAEARFGLKPLTVSARLESRIQVLRPATADDAGNVADLLEFDIPMT